MKSLARAQYAMDALQNTLSGLKQDGNIKFTGTVELQFAKISDISADDNGKLTGTVNFNRGRKASVAVTSQLPV